MIKVLANDGIHAAGIEKLEAAGFQVDTTHIPQEELPTALQDYQALVVRSATKVRQDLIDAVPSLAFIGRGGVGVDNIDVDYAKSKGIAVHNTPAASSESVAELCIGHLYNMVRLLPEANRQMPGADADTFKRLKKSCGKGQELRGRTLGIVGFGRIGQHLASLALGNGMAVLANDMVPDAVSVPVHIAGMDPIQVPIKKVSLEELLSKSDAVSINMPFKAGGSAIIGAEQIAAMKKGAMLINTSRGGAIDEQALLAALDSGQIGAAALDVFTGEPSPNPAVTGHARISLSPHIGAATAEAQARIGIEMADHLIAHFGRQA